MRKYSFWIVCAVLAAAGLVLSVAGTAAGGIVSGIQLDGSGLHVYAPQLNKDKSGSSYVEKEDTLEAFDSIEAELEYGDVRIKAADTDAYGISYRIGEEWDFQYEISDGRLHIRQSDMPSDSWPVWFHNFALFSIGSSIGAQKKEYVTIYVPKDAMLSYVGIKSDSGSASCEKLKAQSMQIAADYGDVSLYDIEVQQLEAVLDSGDLSMREISAGSCVISSEYGNITAEGTVLAEDMRASADSGNIRFQNTRMRDLYLQCEYGDAVIEEAQLQSAELSFDSGNCSLLKAAFDRLDIVSEYGDVKIQMENELSDYAYDLVAEYGSVKAGGKNMGESYISLDENQEKMMKIKCESGNIVIDRLPSPKV